VNYTTSIWHLLLKGSGQEGVKVAQICLVLGFNPMMDSPVSPWKLLLNKDSGFSCSQAEALWHGGDGTAALQGFERSSSSRPAAQISIRIFKCSVDSWILFFFKFSLKIFIF
jgi:hypothetical protein